MQGAVSNKILLGELERHWLTQAEELVELDEDTLFLELGKYAPPLAGESVGALPSRDVLVRRSREWLERNRNGLCDRIRKSQQVRKFLEDRTTYDTATVAVIIAGAIVSSMTGIDLPVPLTVGVVIARIGLERLCKDCWSDQE